MCTEVNNQKLWNVFFYLGCIGSFQWENQQKEIEDNIKYVQKYNDELKDLSYGTREEKKFFVLKVIDLLYEKYEDSRIEYSSISMAIYSYRRSIKIEDFIHWSIFYDDIFQHLDTYGFSDEKKRFITKITDHILLTMQYKKELDRLHNETQELTDEYKSSIREERTKLTEELEEVRSTTNKLNTKYSKLTIDFITILGIFTGCVFAVFGGFEGIKAVLEMDNISKMIIVASIVLFVVIIVLFSFIQFIGVLTERKVVSCGCDLEHNRKHQCHYYERYRILTISLSISLCLFFFGWLITPISTTRYTTLWMFILNNRANAIGLLGLLSLLLWYGYVLWRCKRNTNKGES